MECVGGLSVNITMISVAREHICPTKTAIRLNVKVNQFFYQCIVGSLVCGETNMNHDEIECTMPLSRHAYCGEPVEARGGRGFGPKAIPNNMRLYAQDAELDSCTFSVGPCKIIWSKTLNYQFN